MRRNVWMVPEQIKWKFQEINILKQKNIWDRYLEFSDFLGVRINCI